MDEKSGYQVSAPWQTGTSQAATCGAFFGVLFCGWVTDKVGYKRTIIGALVVMIGAIFMPFFAESLPVLLVGEFLCGLPWGMFVSRIFPPHTTTLNKPSSSVCHSTLVCLRSGAFTSPTHLHHIRTNLLVHRTFVASGVLFGVNQMETKVCDFATGRSSI